MEEDMEVLKEFLELRELHSSNSMSKSYLTIYQEAVRNLIAGYKELERQIKIKNAYLTLINDIAYDYDGCNTVKSLKELIDEIVKMISQAYKNDDWTVMYTDLSQTKNRNILQELLVES